MRNAVELIIAERKRQDIKWRQQNHPDEWWLPILLEEVGELCESMLNEHFRWERKGEQEVRQEVIHIAAVAMAWVECHERLYDATSVASNDSPEK